MFSKNTTFKDKKRLKGEGRSDNIELILVQCIQLPTIYKSCKLYVEVAKSMYTYNLIQKITITNEA